MKHVRSLIAGRSVWSVAVDMTVLDVARFMADRKVGAVTVLEDERLVGIFSERDLMQRVVIRGKSSSETRVADVMTRNLAVGTPDDSHLECMKKMQESGCRHLPIVEGGRLVGMVSLRDLLRVELNEKHELIEWMNAYIHDVPRDEAARES